MSRTYRKVSYTRKFRNPKIIRNLRREYGSIDHLRENVNPDKCKYNHSVGYLKIYDDREVLIASDKETPRVKTPFLIPGKSTKDVCTQRIVVREKNNSLQVITKDDIAKGTKIGSIVLMYFSSSIFNEYMALRIGGHKLHPYMKDRRNPLVLISSAEKEKHANVIFVLKHASFCAELSVYAKRDIKKYELLMAKYDHGQWEINT